MPIAVAHGRLTRGAVVTAALFLGAVTAAVTGPHPSWGPVVVLAGLLSGIGASWSP